MNKWKRPAPGMNKDGMVKQHEVWSASALFDAKVGKYGANEPEDQRNRKVWLLPWGIWILILPLPQCACMISGLSIYYKSCIHHFLYDKTEVGLAKMLKHLTSITVKWHLFLDVCASVK